MTAKPGTPPVIGVIGGSGIYEIDPDTDGPIAPFDVYCDMESHDGGWPLVLAAGSGVDITGETGLTDIELRGDTLPCPDSDAEPPVTSPRWRPPDGTPRA